MRRRAVTWAVRERGYSQRRACGLVGLHPKTYRYAPKRAGDDELRGKLRDLASQRRRFGYRRLGLMLRRQGIKLNHKKLYRLYKEERLSVRRRGGRKRMLAPDGKPVVQVPRPAAPADTPLVRALARAFRWRKLIETGEYATVREIAEAEGVNASYVSRILRLTLLAPEVVYMLVGGREATPPFPVKNLLELCSVRWTAQVKEFVRQ